MSGSADTRKTLNLGEPAPYFEVPVGDNSVSIKDFNGSWLLIFSHPDDIMPVFKTRTIKYVLCKRRIKAIALSNGQTSPLLPGKNVVKKYILKHSLTIIDDADKSIAKKFGLNNPEPDGETKGIFVIDPGGILRIKLYFPMAAERNFHEILKLIDALQEADKVKQEKPRGLGWKNPLRIVIKQQPAIIEKK